MAQRIQSPSSINTFKQCPRKYYYQYILKLAQKVPSIHLQRGKIVHEALENLFKIDISNMDKEYYEFELKTLLQSLFKQKWTEEKKELERIGLTPEQLEFYFRESLYMINNWFNNFMKILGPKVEKEGLTNGFNHVKPKTEVYFLSEEHQVRGFIDAIHEIDGEVSLMDYKTSKREKMSPEYKLQLAIYALLYEEKYGKKPNSVGIDFLRHKQHYLDVDQDLVDFAKLECKFIQEQTISEDVSDYSKKKTFLCNYCDFQEVCFGQKTMDEFIGENGPNR